MRLRDAYAGSLRWRDVFVVCHQVRAGSALARAIDPENGSWLLSEALLALQADQLAMLMWGLGDGKGRPPKPIPRPWGNPDGDGETKTERFVGQSMEMDEMDAWVSRFRAADSGE